MNLVQISRKDHDDKVKEQRKICGRRFCDIANSTLSCFRCCTFRSPQMRKCMGMLSSFYWIVERIYCQHPCLTRDQAVHSPLPHKPALTHKGHQRKKRWILGYHWESEQRVSRIMSPAPSYLGSPRNLVSEMLRFYLCQVTGTSGTQVPRNSD